MVASFPFPVRVSPLVIAQGTVPAQRPVEVLAPAGVVTRRLVLRGVTPADRGGMVDLLERSRAHLRGRINVHAMSEPSGAVFDRLLAATEAGDTNGRQWRRAGFLVTGQPVGMVHILHIQRGVEFSGDAGWWVGPEFCGNGIATEMVGAAVHHGLRDLPVGLGLHTIRAAISRSNEASQRVASKAGFRRCPGVTTSVAVEGVEEVHEVWESHAAV